MRCRPVPTWTPPLNSDQLTAVLAKLRGWRPFDGGALLDDIGAVLDDVTPAEDDLKALAERLDGHLVQLLDIAVASQAGRRDESARALIEQVRALHAEVVPDGYVQAVAHLRRVAWRANELLEALVRVRCVKEAV
ncbi:hypothetical protein GCM10010524_39660 [Streptomyces mexicanus]|jgi:hypothetical protein